MPGTAVIIVAAGRGTRAQSILPKQWVMLGDRPVVAHALHSFAEFPTVLVVDPQHFSMAREWASSAHIVAGGSTRRASVLAGLRALEGRGFDHVLIHDGARPLVSAAVIARVLQALNSHKAAAPALAVTDALWTGADGLVTGTQDRTGLFRAQTPQGFCLTAILQAHLAHTGEAADDVEVARAAGLDVAIVEGDEDNIKLTWPGDFDRALQLLKGRI